MFQSHFQGSSTSNTQKIFLPKPIWEKLSKDQQQMIIDHNRSLPKSGSSSLSTPNKSPSPLPHKPTPQQTAKSQQVHTHQSDQSTADTTKVETTPSDPLLAMVHQSIHTSADDASDITKVLSARGLNRSKSVNATSSSMPITPTISWWTVVPMEALLVQTCESSTKPTARSTFQALTTMKLLVLMWSLLQPFSTPLWEKSLASSMNMPTLGRDPPSIHQVNLNGLKPLLMKNPSKLVAPNSSLLWMDILSLSSSEMV